MREKYQNLDVDIDPIPNLGNVGLQHCTHLKTLTFSQFFLVREPWAEILLPQITSTCLRQVEFQINPMCNLAVHMDLELLNTLLSKPPFDRLTSVVFTYTKECAVLEDHEKRMAIIRANLRTIFERGIFKLDYRDY